jgi:lysyl-tRNA synthetase class 2
MLEFYQAYVDYYEIMDMVEEMISFVAAEVLGEKGKEIEWQGKRINLAGSWPRRAIIDLLGEKIGARISVPLDREQLVQICRRLGLETDSRMGSGKILDKLFGELVEHELTNPTMVMDYPLETSPLAKRHRDNPDLVERFELIIGGMEIANAFSELNDPLDQRKRFEAQMRLRDLGDEEAQVLDEDYLRAMEYGLPPTGGVGIGIDRLTMLLTGQESIKDVILFPTLRPEEAK